MRATLLDDAEAGSQLICAREAIVGILDTGATTNLVRFRLQTHRNSLLGEIGLPRVASYPSQARFKFGGGRMGGARFDADITAGVAGTKGG